MVRSAVVRTCVGCRERATARELLRLVAGDDASGPPGAMALVPDPRRTAAGRGAHLHPTTDCLARAERKRAFPRALRVTVALSTLALREYVERLAAIEEQTDASTDSTRSQ